MLKEKSHSQINASGSMNTLKIYEENVRAINSLTASLNVYQ